MTLQIWNYRKISNIRHTKSPNLNVSCLVLQLSLHNPMKPGVKLILKDVVGAAPTGDAPTTSEWSTILLPTKVRLILETWWYIDYITISVFTEKDKCVYNFDCRHGFHLLNRQFWIQDTNICLSEEYHLGDHFKSFCMKMIMYNNGCDSCLLV